MSGSSASRESFTLARDCRAAQVPYGDAVTLTAGQAGIITQALGGSFTVYIEGSLFRIEGKDADAIGQPPPEPLTVPENAGDEDVERVVWEQLYTVFDPEIPVNVVDLGLVYNLELSHLDDGQRRVHVELTLTAPGCGMGDIMIEDTRAKLEMIPTIGEARIDLVFDPPWNQTMMTDAAKLQTGMM